MPGVLPSDQYAFFNTPVFNAQVPKEGPRVIGGVIPFSDAPADKSFELNLSLTQNLQQISQVQCVFMDNSQNDSEVLIKVGLVNIAIRFPPGAVGYLPLPAPKNTQLTFTSDGNVNVPFLLFNVPMPLGLWYPQDDSAESVACPVSASTVLGDPGALGDTLEGLLIIPLTTSPGQVTITDGGLTAEVVFQGGGGSVSNLVPFYVPVDSISVNGAWTVTTGANVLVRATGQFTSAA